MAEESRIPIVAAMAVAYGDSYENSLKKFNRMTKQEQTIFEASYNDDNMGYGPEAWNAYVTAKRARGEVW